MPFVITWFQDEGVTERRAQVRPVHLEHITQNADRIITSGGIFSDDGKSYTGGLLILDTDNRDEAISFIESDPFFLNRVFTTYTIHRWSKFIFDHKCVVA